MIVEDDSRKADICFVFDVRDSLLRVLIPPVVKNANSAYLTPFLQNKNPHNLTA
jgi:hypothetical protein